MSNIPRWIVWTYEGVMTVLALAVIYLLTQPDQGWVKAANHSIWAIFMVDYVVRFVRAPSKWPFIRQNIPDLIAILPLDFLRIARLARLARLVRLIRAAAILWRVSRDVRGILRANGLGYVLLFTGGLVVVGGVAVWMIEPSLDTLGDGIWWAVVTATTVGYGDISPSTGWGRVLAVVLMMVGIGTLGMITGSIATWFLSPAQSGSADVHVEHIRSQLTRWPEMSPAERRRVAAMLMALAESEFTERASSS